MYQETSARYVKLYSRIKKLLYNTLKDWREDMERITAKLCATQKT
jgi:hypothetical protein